MQNIDEFIEFKETDLDDPELLKELESLKSQQQPQLSEPKATQQVTITTFDDDTNFEDLKVDFTEEDMNDPSLLVFLF